METVLRVAVIYVALMFGFRVMGKRELSSLSPFELVTLLIIPEIVSQSLTGPDHSMTNGLIGTATLFCLVFINSMWSYLSKTFRHISESPPSLLVHDGRLIEGNLHRERVPPDELYSEMHKVGLETLSQVKWAILEADGKISIVPADGQQIRRAAEEEPG